MFGLKLKILSEDEATKQKLNKYYWIRTPEELKKIEEQCDNGTHLEYFPPTFNDYDIKFYLASNLCEGFKENYN